MNGRLVHGGFMGQQLERWRVFIVCIHLQSSGLVFGVRERGDKLLAYHVWCLALTTRMKAVNG